MESDIAVSLPRYVLEYFLVECEEGAEFWKSVPGYSNETEYPTPYMIAMWKKSHDAIQKALA